MAKKTTTKKRPTVSENYELIKQLTKACNFATDERRQIRKEQNEGLLKLLSRVVQERPEPSQDGSGPMDVVKLDDLARVLLLSRERCDAAIALARRRYHDVLRDMREIKEHAGKSEGISEMFLKMLNRYKVYHQQDLEMLGVTLTEISPGVSFDPEYHEVIDKHPTNKNRDVDTVAVSRTPLMTWNDASNTPQMHAAQVVVFVEERASTASAAGDRRHCKEGSRNGLLR